MIKPHQKLQKMIRKMPRMTRMPPRPIPPFRDMSQSFLSEAPGSLRGDGETSRTGRPSSVAATDLAQLSTIDHHHQLVGRSADLVQELGGELVQDDPVLGLYDAEHVGITSRSTFAVCSIANSLTCSFFNSTQPIQSARPRGKRFVSKRYGYEIVLPARYDAYYTTEAWNGKDFPFGSSGKVDVFQDWGDRKFVAAATPLSAGPTLRKWEASYIATMESFCQKSRAFRKATLGGIAAREFINVCPGYDVIAVVALRRGRGYFFQFVSPTVNTAASDRRSFDAGRRTFRFTSK